LAVILTSVAFFWGRYLYREFWPLPRCASIPEQEEFSVRSVKPTVETVASFMASRSDLACPEAERSFFEWFFLNIHYDKYWVETSFNMQRTDHGRSYATIKISSATAVSPLILEIERAGEVWWSESGLKVGMMTRGPDGERGETFLRYLETGPRAGCFELRILTRKKELHIFLKPISPGLDSENLFVDPTRPGSWFHGSIITLMGEIDGEFMEFKESGTEVTKIPGDGPAARGYLEHIWGQGYQPRFAWDWGEFGDLKQQKALFFTQSHRQREGIVASVVAAVGDSLPLKLIHRPPQQFVRVFYNRFFEHGGLLHPQQINVWGFAADSPDKVVMSGFSHGFHTYYTAFYLYGKVEGGGQTIDWSVDPQRTVVDLQMGRMAWHRHPASPGSLRQTCQSEGCMLEWDHQVNNHGKIEYWVLRVDGGSRMEEGVPVGVIEYPEDSAADGGGNEESGDNKEGEAAKNEQEPKVLQFHDPAGSVSSIYRLVAVYVPDVLVHKRLQAGYIKCSNPPVLSFITEFSPSTALAFDRENADKYTGPERKHAIFQYPEKKGSVRSRISLQGGRRDGSFEFIREKRDKERWIKQKVIPPRFAPGVQIQSFSAVSLDHGALALAWSERSPVMDGPEFTEWEVFVSFVNIESGAFRVLPVSMSEAESVDVSLERRDDLLTVTWSECSGDRCRTAREEAPIPPLP
jgi:hypothetical protein